MTKFSIKQNVIIKSQIPPHGIVSSNPERTQRIAEHFLQDLEQLPISWGVTVYLGKSKLNDQTIFTASVPMGASGSAHAFHELMAAGAKRIIRLGSNDVWVTKDDINSVVLISEAKGLRGLGWDHGMDESVIDESIFGSAMLMETIESELGVKGIKYSKRVCFNVDDYHAYLYPDLAANSDRIKERLSFYDRFSPYCRDMETASLFLKANEFNVEAASVLQNVVKQKAELPYEGLAGSKAKEFELQIGEILLNCLNK